jgi:hypothetical protein
VTSECFAAISGFAAGFHPRFQAPPSIPDSRACPHQVPQFSISGITPYFQNHGHIYEDRHAARSRMPSKQTDLTDKAKLDHRIRTIQALVDFCKVQETPRRRRWPPSRDWGLVGHCGPRDAEAPKSLPNPQSSLNTQCIFYLGNQQLPLETRFFCFCRPRKAREHVENVYLRHINAHDPLDCPLCGKVLEGITRFKSHAASRPQLFYAGVTGP